MDGELAENQPCCRFSIRVRAEEDDLLQVEVLRDVPGKRADRLHRNTLALIDWLDLKYCRCCHIWIIHFHQMTGIPALFCQ